jgi:SAM-dependent methyltransferase
VGGGDSRLVDYLLNRGVTCLTVLDVSGTALARSRQRLGLRGARVTWIEADVTGQWDIAPLDVWHDRAVFHFLTTAEQRDEYIRQLRRVLKPGGSAIIGTFAPDGPMKCSGLPVERYSAEMIASTLGSDFDMVEALRHVHQTPTGAQQAFTFARLVRGQSSPLLSGDSRRI